MPTVPSSIMADTAAADPYPIACWVNVWAATVQ